MSMNFKAALRSALSTNEPVSRQYYASRLQAPKTHELNRSYAAPTRSANNKSYEVSSSVDGLHRFGTSYTRPESQSETQNVSTEDRIEALYNRILKLRDKKLCTVRSLKAVCIV